MSKSILIIEDEPFISDIYKRALTAASYSIDVAADGEIAKEKMFAQAYDLILLDIMLPKITGIDILKEIRTTENKAKTTPVILITNLWEDSIINEAKRLGIDGYIMKAKVTPPELVTEINSFFEKHQATPTEEKT